MLKFLSEQEDFLAAEKVKIVSKQKKTLKLNCIYIHNKNQPLTQQYEVVDLDYVSTNKINFEKHWKVETTHKTNIKRYTNLVLSSYFWMAHTSVFPEKHPLQRKKKDKKDCR